jgi:hypothetical protein
LLEFVVEHSNLSRLQGARHSINVMPVFACEGQRYIELKPAHRRMIRSGCAQRQVGNPTRVKVATTTVNSKGTAATAGAKAVRHQGATDA